MQIGGENLPGDGPLLVDSASLLAPDSVSFPMLVCAF